MNEQKNVYFTRKKLQRMISDKQKQAKLIQKELRELEVALEQTEKAIELRKNRRD